MSRFTEYHGEIPVLKDKKMFPEAVAKLAEYEDAEDKGLLLVLPCKVGDTVYEVTYCQAPSCELCKGYTRNDNCYTKHRARIFEHGMFYSSIPKFNKTVFTTKAEAEKALAEMEKRL